MKPGGEAGGSIKWLIGFVLAAVGVYFLFNSVHVVSGHHGYISGMMRGGGLGGGMGETTSMGIIFVPFILSMIALFVNAKWKLAW